MTWVAEHCLSFGKFSDVPKLDAAAVLPAAHWVANLKGQRRESDVESLRAFANTLKLSTGLSVL